MSTDLVVSPARTRVLLALIAVYERDGRATVRDVAEEADRSLSTAYFALNALRDLGLVWWEPNHAGTLRPTVGVLRTHVRSGGTWSATMARELDDPGAAPTARGPADENTHCEGRTST